MNRGSLTDGELYQLALRVSARPQRKKGGYMVHCPCHEDRVPSLSLWLDARGGLHMHCWSDAGCTFKDLHSTLVERYGFPRMYGAGGADADAPAHPNGVRAPSAPDDRGHWAGAQRPAPHDPLILRHRSLGRPADVFAYRSPLAGHTYGYAARYQRGEAPREWRFWSWWWWRGDYDATERVRLRCRRPPAPTPLMELDRIVSEPSKVVWCCEGERSARAAQRLAPQVIGTTWIGGADADRWADWSVLAGRSVVLWPDGDLPGQRCMERISAHLSGLGASVWTVDGAARIPRLPGEPEGPRTKGWDLADVPETPEAQAAFAEWWQAQGGAA